MPIRRELRYFYPIDWPQLSALVRFGVVSVKVVYEGRAIPG